MNLDRHLPSARSLAVALCSSAILLSCSWLGAAASAATRPATSGLAIQSHVPVHGYDAKWLFNANDGSPTVKVTVTPAGAFNFHYLPSYCKGAGFMIKGKFESTKFRNVPYNALFAGLSGYLVDFTSAGSCTGSQPGNSDNTFTWKGARGLNDVKWPNSRYVQGVMTQTACVTGGSCGPLDIDWGMSAA